MAKQRWQKSGESGASNAPIGGASKSYKREGRWQDKPNPTGPSQGSYRMFAGIFALVMVLALTYIVITLFRYSTPADLSLMSAQYRTALLDPNAFALEDASALVECRHFVTSGRTDDDSLNSEELNGRIKDLSNLAPKRSWFGGLPTNIIVYVNLLGFSRWDPSLQPPRAVPYVLPDDFEIPATLDSEGMQKAVPVRRIIDQLLAAKADQKLLVLDCQRQPSHWPLGVLTNEFVESVQQELNTIPADERRGLFVLASCSPGEVTWVDREVGRSTFGHAFVQAISGAADATDKGKPGNGDGYVSLDELLKYTQESVRSASRLRVDSQTPMLLAFDENISLPKVRLGVIPWGTKPPTAEPAKTDVKLLGQLEENWKRYYDLVARSPAPWRNEPLEFRELEESLLRAESFYRAGDLEAVGDRLVYIGDLLNSLANPSETFGSGGSFSIPLAALLTSSAEKEQAAEGSPYEPVLKDLLDRRLTYKDFRQRIETPELFQTTPPIEIYFANQLARMLPSSAEDKPTDAALALIKRRVQAEQAAAPGNYWAPQVTPWIKSRVSEADQNRRLIEDKFIAANHLDVPVRSPVDTLNEEMVDRQYDRAIRQGNDLARAFDVRDRALAELPYWIRWAGRRPWITLGLNEDKNLRDQSQQPLAAMFEALSDLNRELAKGPSKDSPDQADVSIENIFGWAKAVEDNRSTLVQLLLKDTASLSSTANAPETQIVWRKINDFLLVPFPANPTDPAESARTRKQLLSRVCQPVTQKQGEALGAQTGGQEVGKNASVSPEDRTKLAQEMARLAKSLFDLEQTDQAKSIDLTNIASNAELGAIVGQWWRNTRNLVTSRDLPLDQPTQLFRADTACRMMEASGLRPSEITHSERLRKLQAAEFLAWHAERTAEDFWAGLPGQETHYFFTVGNDYLSQAGNAHPGGKTAFNSLASRLAYLKDAADRIGLTTNPSALRFSIKEQASLRPTAELPENLPPGHASISLSATPNSIPIKQENDQFIIQKYTGKFPDPHVTALLRYRGHERDVRVEIAQAGDPQGPVVVYENRRPLVGTYSLALAETDRSDLKLLFVLDCSDSMKTPEPKAAVNGDKAPTRLELLQGVLRDFADDRLQNAFEVGVRWFGSEVSRDGLVEKALNNNTILKLAMTDFDRSSFLSAIPVENHLGGFTPMINALIRAKDDFKNIDGDRQVVLITDGLDNWVTVRKADGTDVIDDAKWQVAMGKVREAFAGTGIKINTVGLSFKDKSLEDLAKLTEGRSVSVTNSQELLAELTGISGVASYAAFSQANEGHVPDPEAKLVTRATEHELSQGFFEVRVRGSRGQPLGDPFNIRVLPGDYHELLFRGGRVQYADNDPGGRRIDNKQAKVTLGIVRSRPTGGGVELEFYLYKPDDPTWQPPTIEVRIQPNGQGDSYVFHQLPPNKLRTHWPAWILHLEDWPVGVKSANLTVSWNDPKEPTEVKLDQDTFNDRAVPGIILGTPQYRDLEPSSPVKNGTRMILNMEFEPSTRPEMTQWAIVPQGNIRRSRQVYDQNDGLYQGIFDMEGVDRVKAISIYPPNEERAEKAINTRFEVTTDALN